MAKDEKAGGCHGEIRLRLAVHRRTHSIQRHDEDSADHIWRILGRPHNRLVRGSIDRPDHSPR
jgi:hypothetical protein